MFSILEIDLATSPIPIYVDGLSRSPDGWDLLPNRSSGELLLDPLDVLYCYQWEGLEIFSVETEMAFAKPTNDTLSPNFHQSVSGIWTSILSPFYYDIETARSLLLTWEGPLQIQLRVSRRIDGTSPGVKTLRIGHHTMGDMSDYVFRYLLTKIFRVSAKISRPVRATGASIAIPSGFDPAKVSVPQMMIVGTGEKVGLTISGNLLVFSRNLSAEAAHILFNYPLHVETENQLLMQVEAVPCGYIRNLENTGTHQVNARSQIRVDNNQVISSFFQQTSDITAELVVLADRLADARMYADKVAAKIKSTAIVDVPAYGRTVGLHVLGPIKNGPLPTGSGAPASAALFSSVVKFKVTGFPGANFTQYIQREMVEGGVNVSTLII